MMRTPSILLSATALIAFSLSSTVTADPGRLAHVLAQQPESVQARYAWRHPKETLEFFGIEPGMTVVEALPGGGWYSKILLPYLGSNGTLIGADYSPDMYPLFGFFSDEILESKKTWVADWSAEAESWRGEDGATVSAFVFGALPESMKGTADAVLLIRALHNLNRFESQGGFRTAALQNAFDVLKPGGIVGVVQHQAAEDKPDDWANGATGYLKKSAVIGFMQAAGFELVAESPINENPKDQPGEKDVVWRLPPTLSIEDENEETADAMRAIGESNRMTLLFRKP
ncbi:MAG TPA: methyltransferase [Xanthomonadales bacterium]|nr:methyltransferase [Xanthomonadales bacterium]